MKISRLIYTAFGLAACGLVWSYGERTVSLMGEAISAPSFPMTRPAAAVQEQAPGPTFFVLGVWIAPPQEMQKWRDRGVNTIVSVGEGVDPELHHQQAKALGLKQIRRPRPNKIAEDLVDPSVIAFETHDEPTNIVNGRPRASANEVSAEQAPWHAAAKAAGVYKPVFTNHIGDHIWHKYSRIGLEVAEYHKRSDWYGADTYQIAKGWGNLLTQDGFTSTHQGHILHQQRIMAPSAPLLSFVQTVAYYANTPLPSPNELKAQIWSSVINGASMVAVFPVRLGPEFAWDGTPDDLAAVLESEFKKITSIENILIDQEKGGARSGKIYSAAAEGTKPSSGQLPYPFEARVIQHEGKPYTIVLNLSDAPAALSFPEWGISEVQFMPNEVKQGYDEEWAGR